MPAKHKTSLKMENRAKSEIISNKVELVILMTSAQKKDIEKTLDDYCQFFSFDRGRALQLISEDANKELLNYKRAS
jgi:hypothetical protein